MTCISVFYMGSGPGSVLLKASSAFSVQFGFRGLCKLSCRGNRGRAQACSLLDPVCLWAVVEGCPLYGLKETGAGLCMFMYVCVHLKIGAVCWSHTVGPTSCFHCPSLLPRERKEEGDEKSGSPGAPPYLLLSFIFLLRCPCSLQHGKLQWHRYVRNAWWRNKPLVMKALLFLLQFLSAPLHKKKTLFTRKELKQELLWNFSISLCLPHVGLFAFISYSSLSTDDVSWSLSSVFPVLCYLQNFRLKQTQS